MLVKKADEVPLQPVQEGIGIRWLLASEDGVPNYAMRIIEIEPGVVFPPHHHPYEHEIYVLEGRGIVSGEGGEAVMEPGIVLYIAPDELHGYRNEGEETLRFICVIPLPPQA